MKVSIVPVLEDNYAYVLICSATKKAAVIDPVQPARVKTQLEKDGVQVTAIITTHRHSDHAGGNLEFLKLFPDVQVYGGDEKIPGVTHVLKDQETFQVGSLNIVARHTPCHTTESTSYIVDGEGKHPDVLFTGDTLFVAGCGKFFEGTAEQMRRNMEDVYAKLKPDTLVYPGHEYTVSNLKFAQSVDPENSAVKEKLLWSEKKRASEEPTVPSTIAEEKSYNPFMRIREAALQKASGETDPTQVMNALRDMKNNFKVPRL